jgi:outer membrane receptor protein involved in Fe transport
MHHTLLTGSRFWPWALAAWFCLLQGLTATAQQERKGTLWLAGSCLTADRNALAGTTVLLNERVCVTDGNGKYRFMGLAPGTYRLLVSSLGVQRTEREVVITDNTTLDLILDSAPIDLGEALVQAGTDAAPTATLHRIDLRTRRINSAQDLLTLAPGLFVAQHAGGGKAEQIFFRGFDIDHGTDLYVSVDGMPVNMVSHAHGQGYADLHFVIPETVEEVQVHKGPYATRFGDLATSGTVEFRTRRTLDRSQVKVEAGMFDTYRAVAMIDLLGEQAKRKPGRPSAYVAGEYGFSQAYFLAKQDFMRGNLFGKFSALCGHRTLFAATASTFSAQWNASGQLPARAVANGQLDRFGAVDSTEGGRTARSNLNLELTHTLPDGAVLKNQLYGVQYDFHLFSNFTFFLEDTVNGDMIDQVDDRTIVGYQGSFAQDVLLAQRPARVTVGAGLRYDMADIALRNAPRRMVTDTIVAGAVDQANSSLYTDLQWEMTPKLRVNAGLRADMFNFRYHDKQGQDSLSGDQRQMRVSPKLSVTYQANERVQYYLRTGMGFHSNDARAVVVNAANRTLPRAYGADLGTTLKPMRNLLVNAALWGLYMESELVFVGDGGVVETSDPTRRFGAELSLRYQLAKGFFADVDVNATDARLLGPPKGEDRVPLAPALTTAGGLAYQAEKGWNGSLRYRHIADRPANEDNSVVADGYWLCDAMAGYRWTRLEVGASVENLFDVTWNQAQFDTASRLPGEAEAVSELHYTPGTPFSARVFMVFAF